MQKLINLSKQLLKFFITAILITVPLYPKFPLFRIPGTYVSIRLEDFLIAATLLLLLPLIIKNLKSLLKNNVVRAIALFLSIAAISVVSGIFLTKTVSPGIGLLHLLRRVEYFSMFVVGYLFIKTNYQKGTFEYIIKILLLVNAIVFIYGLGQRYFDFPVIVTQNEEYSKGIALRWIPGAHINSTFAGHYDLASYLVMTLPVFVGLFFSLKSKLSKLIIFISIAAGFWLLSSAVSRISIVAFLLATMLTLLLLKKYKEIIVAVLISILIFGLSPDLRTRYMRIIEVTIDKISSAISINTFAAEEGTEVFEDRSTSIRLNVEWPRAVRALTKNPLLGTGYSSIGLATDNDYLRLLGETGILGFSSFMLILYAIFKEIKKKLNLSKYFQGFDANFIAGILGAVGGILLTAVFIDIFEASKFAITFWLMMGLVLGRINYDSNE